MTPQITFTDEFHMTDSSLSWENIIIEYGEPSLKNLFVFGWVILFHYENARGWRKTYVFTVLMLKI